MSSILICKAGKSNSSRLSALLCRGYSSIVAPTFLEIYENWKSKFEDANIPEPDYSSGYIAAHLLGYKTFSVVPREALIKPILADEMHMYDLMGSKRLERMPIQYVIGNWDFFGVNVKMRPPVFIPRPETEELAERVLKEIMKQASKDTHFKVLEIGCGTGAISLSLLNRLRSVPVQFITVDAAEHAVQLTMENAKYLNLLCAGSERLRVFKHKLGHDPEDSLLALGPFDLIVSNPPYIPSKDMENLPEEISRYEDHDALHGGDLGLDVISNILKSSEMLLSLGGVVWLEIDENHSKILQNSCYEWKFEYHRDLFGAERFCRVTRLKH